jgi:glycosyltransferase involved in cell wall biosynthesis
MIKLYTPGWVKEHLAQIKKVDGSEQFLAFKLELSRLSFDEPEISVVIPAWNESKKIIPTLSSLAAQNTNRKVELIVVNNNSTDDTQNILDALGVKSIHEPSQGISFARQNGLLSAKGKYHLCADADSIYPPDWIDEMVKHLENSDISCVYGKYAFIPEKKLNRLQLAVFELVANIIFVIRKTRKEYLNVMGFNFGFRKDDGLKVGGFNTGRQKWSDGWMGMTLLERGKLKRVESGKAVVWTNPRRLKIDGGFIKAFLKRAKKELFVIKEYLFAN